jgi:virginiamycin B lyase
MPDGIDDPHTLIFDNDNNIWFTAQNSNAVGQLNVATGKVRFVKMSQNNARPYGIKIDHKQRVWTALLGTNRLAMIDHKFNLVEISLPRQNARTRRLEVDSSNMIWYVDYRGGFLGRYNPQDRTFKEWPMPSGKDSKPYATGIDSKGWLWMSETGPFPNNLVAFNTKTETFLFNSPVKEGGLIRHMYYDSKSKKLWFGVDTGYIVSAKVN